MGLPFPADTPRSNLASGSFPNPKWSSVKWHGSSPAGALPSLSPFLSLPSFTVRPPACLSRPTKGHVVSDVTSRDRRWVRRGCKTWVTCTCEALQKHCPLYTGSSVAALAIETSERAGNKRVPAGRARVDTRTAAPSARA
jgi:hypothetical protein